ncbi:MAG: hypothetical protein GY774_08045 [Planctomycetes bacterium]|nr:hypothetical protein [Planctomycetota bacterium]
MSKVRILFSVVILLFLASLVQAEENELGITFDITYVSKYIWHGFNFYGHDNSATQPSIDIDLWGTGFGMTLWHSRANRGGFRDLEEFDYILYYGDSAFEDTYFSTDYTISWLYYDFSDAPTKDTDLQEFVLQFSWPNVLPEGIVPNYYIGKLWPAKSSSAVQKDIGGWVHVVGLGYDWTIPGILPESSEHVINLIADLTYNDGYGSAGADHDWSHATLGASTSFEIAENLTFTPALYYQMSMDDSVNNEDEVWTGLSLTYQF